MKAILLGVALAALCTATDGRGAEATRDDGVRYLPDIHGQLAGARGYVPTNVCLRRKGSEITQCAYTDSVGRFRLPSFGEIHRVQPGDPDWHGSEYPEDWLELGTRTRSEKRLWTVELAARRHVAIRLDCDPARAVGGTPSTYCERRSAP